MLSAFLLALPALFSIISPFTGALIFREVTANWADAERKRLARRVGVYSMIVMLVSILAGSHILSLFGISLAALRVAGGLVLTGFAWEMVGAPERRDGRKQEQASSPGADDPAFFPLTLPFTTGPGTIAVCVALGAGQTARFTPGRITATLGSVAAAMVMAVVITLMYAYSDRLSARLGRTGTQTVSRLSAFLLLCIGVQILITGIIEALTPLVGR